MSFDCINALFVGGSRDGMRSLMKTPQPSVSLPKRVAYSMVDHGAYRDGPELSMETEIYLLQRFSDKDGQMHFVYVFDGEPSPLARLIEGYHDENR